LVLSGDKEAALIRELRNTIDYDHWPGFPAYSGDGDRRFQPKVITDSGDRDHVVTRPTGSA
jgi:hypothetical protein